MDGARTAVGAMPRSVTVKPLWSDAPDWRPMLGRHAHLADSTIEQAIGKLKRDQDAYLARLEQGRTATPSSVFNRHPMVVRARKPTRRPTPKPEPVTTRVVRAAVDVLADVHPLVAANVLELSGGDTRRLRVISPTQVLVLNRPCEAL